MVGTATEDQETFFSEELLVVVFFLESESDLLYSPCPGGNGLQLLMCSSYVLCKEFSKNCVELLYCVFECYVTLTHNQMCFK